MKYSEARKLIKEGDILLFRGTGLISWLIARYTGGKHTHAAIAHWDDDVLQCVEFREFKGGRIVSLRNQVNDGLTIDVFRPVNKIEFDDIENNKLVKRTVIYDDKCAKGVARDVILLTGRPYGWKTIFRMFLRFIPFLRLTKQHMDDQINTDIFVCSTAVAASIRKHFIDPVNNLADDMVSPADLARSPIMRYLFTLSKD